MKFILRSLPYLFFLLVIIALLFPALHSSNDTIIFGSDSAKYFYFQFSFLHTAIQKQQFPFWNPYIFNGIPYAANIKNAIFYPFFWLFALFPVSGKTITFYIFIHLLIASFSMYWLTHSVLSFPRIAASVSTLVFLLGGYFPGRIHAGHLDMIATASYIPLVFGSFLLLLRRTSIASGSSLLIIAICSFVLAFISGYQTSALFILEGICIIAVIYSVANRSFKPLLYLMLSCLFSFGILGVLILPNQEYLAHSIRSKNMSYAWASTGSLHPSFLPEFVVPFYNGGIDDYYGAGNSFDERASVSGRIVALLTVVGVIIGLFRKRFRTVVVTFAFISFFSIWIALAHHAPIDIFHFFFSYLPIYNKLHYPVRHLLLFSVSISILAGIGVQCIQKKWFHIAVFTLLCFELFPYAEKFIILGASPAHSQDTFLQKNISRDRKVNANYHIVSPTVTALEMNAAMHSLFFSTNGYETAQLFNYREFTDSIDDKITSSIPQLDASIPVIEAVGSIYFSLLGGNYIVSDPTQYTNNYTDSKFNLVKSTETYSLYTDSQAFPRYWFVPVALQDKLSNIKRIIGQERVNPKEIVLITTSPNTHAHDCIGNEQGNVQVLLSELNKIILSVAVPCNGYITSNEVMYPGWETFIDGKKTSIIQGNISFRTFPITKGVHEVLLKFNPIIYVHGAIVSSVSIALLFLYIYLIKTKTLIL